MSFVTPTLKSTPNEMVEWFHTTFPQLVESMYTCSHHYDNKSLNCYHYEGSIWTHTLMVFKLSEVFSSGHHLIKWSSLLHDIGKPLSQESNNEKKRISFIGHEGLSAYMAIDILNKADISIKDKIAIFKIISLHGLIRNYINDDRSIREDKFLEDFKGIKTVMEYVLRQVQADTFGRFCIDKFRPLIDLIPEFRALVCKLSDGIDVVKDDSKPQLTILIGPPASGKSTWMNDNWNNEIVLSRDSLVEAAGKRRGLSYNESYSYLITDKEATKNEIEDVLKQQIIDARENRNNVIVDMTNMVKKTRRRWISDFSKYNKKAIVFCTGFDALLERSKIRSEKTGKVISEKTIVQICRYFSLPLYSEGFDEIEYIWQ